MKILWSKVLLVIYFVAQGHCLTLLDGQMTTRTEFCVGDSLTLVCNGSAASYTWLVGNFTNDLNDLAVSPVVTTSTEMGFTSTFVSDSETRLSFIAQAEHNGTEAICRDFNSDSKFLIFEISIYGPPSAPMVTVVSNNALNSFTVGITSTDPASICTSEYNITLADSAGGSNVAQVPANISSFEAATLFNANLELCSLNYQFSVVASTGGGVRTANGEIILRGLPSITAEITADNITVDIPDILQNCIVNLNYSFQGDSGIFMANTDVLLLSMFNTETCTDGMLRISPIILGEARTSLGTSIEICEPAANVEVSSMAPSRFPMTTADDSASLSVTAGALMTILGVTITLMAAML